MSEGPDTKNSGYTTSESLNNIQRGLEKDLKVQVKG